MANRTKINILWLKRDLRLRDHEPLREAIAQRLPILILFCFEPRLMDAPDSAVRHWRFAFESLQNLQAQLRSYKQQLYYTQHEVIDTLEQINQFYSIDNIFSHEEVGIKLSFDRDKTVKTWCLKKSIHYLEFAQSGILRGKKNRVGWQKHLEDNYFGKKPNEINLSELKTLMIPDALEHFFNTNPLSKKITTYQQGFQQGGELFAWKYFHSFLEKRCKYYSRQISKPERSRISCSRLSPYLAFGCISSRDVYQLTNRQNAKDTDDWNLKNFRSRLWWRSHYIQKLETSWHIEIEPINSVFNQLNRAKESPLLEAWKNAKTGFPMIDASMRCLQANGWINFRMRATLVTFASFGLWLHWRPIALHLARLFLDFEPGIHYPQIQMQAGLTGYHTLRVFNPTLQVRKHDEEGVFIKKWLPELVNIPSEHLSEPWKMTAMEQTFYKFKIGIDYPLPIIDYDQEVAKNKDRYWEFRQSKEAKNQLLAIWKKFCIPSDIKKYEKEEDVCNFD